MRIKRALGFLAGIVVGLSAGGALATAVSAAPQDFAVKSVTASESTTQAGAHPDVTFGFGLTTDETSPAEPPGIHDPWARLRNGRFDLPPGLIGDPNAVPACTIPQFRSFQSAGEGCPQSTQVGVVRIDLWTFQSQLSEPIYNVVNPNERYVARLGFYAGNAPFFVNVEVRSASDYGLTATVEGSPATPVVDVTTELWGVPAASSHDRQRLTPREAYPGLKSESPPRESSLAPTAFMTNPVTCGVPLSLTVAADSYVTPGQFSTMSAQFPETTGCSRVLFEPTLEVQSTSGRAAGPTGLIATLKVPQSEAPGGLASTDLRGAQVVLPRGMAIDASAADGLAACSAEEVRFGTELPAACPEASKIGTAEFDVPQLSRRINGAIYQRTPEAGHLFRIWLVTDELGVHVKIPGEIHADTSTGQVSSVFVDTPQVPLRELILRFKSGSHGVLVNPSSCGRYESRYELEPWSGNPAVVGTSPMDISEGCQGAPFAPKLEAGSTDVQAGAFSPFTFTLRREDAEPNVSSIEATLPKGMLAKLAGVPLCPADMAATGNCPSGSRVGTTTVATGAGPTPLWIPQPGKQPTAVYLAGPYKGAPYSLIVKVPAQAGPFDLGTVVTRAGLYVDPFTAVATVKSDPLPQILEGVPVLYRTINIAVDKPEFTLNPTNCSPMKVAANVTAVGGASASPSSQFEVANCGELKFKPRLQLSLKGSMRHAGHPALKAVLTYPSKGAYANIARAQVNLPHSEFIDQGNLNKTCTRPVLLAGNCPKTAIYGKVKAWTPLLEKPLEGPVYLVGGFGYKLPALVAELNGQIRVLLVGKVDSGPNKGIRNTFETVPDAPVSRFVLEMKGGPKYSLLENSEDLCRKTQRASARFTAQNGVVDQLNPKIAVSCPKNGTKQTKHKRKAHSK
jgi:hypothetical protein